MACALLANGNAEKWPPVLIVAVALVVGAPVMVAALVNRNDIVKVVDTASRDCHRRSLRALVYGLDHGHGIVLAPERGHHHGCAHAHGPGHAHGHGVHDHLV